MIPMNLYRRSALRASAVVLLIALIGLTIVVAQRKSQHRLRATALVELTTDAHGTKNVKVIPITILDQGNFHDASFYKAAPEPMALGPGVVYEAEKTGLPVGFATVSSASVRNGVWTAEGRWQPASDKPKASKSATPASNPADERPILHRAGSSSAAPAAATPTPVTSASPTPASPQSENSDDRPTLHRHEDTAGQATPSPSPSAPQTSASPSPAATPAESSEASSASEDPDRPLLRRGKPEPRPEPTSISSSSTSASGNAKTSKPDVSTPAGTQVLVAVSDAAPDDPRSFQFMWKPGEEAPIDAKMRQLAAAEVAKGEGGSTGSSVSEQALRNVEVRSFDLDLSNDAVLVLSAELPPGGSSNATKPAGKAHSQSKNAATTEVAPKAQVTHYVTLIARVDLDGNPQVLAASVTDSSHLDVAPRLQLIDAVDVDGDGVGELLFREYDFDNKSFIVYGVRHGTLTKLFEGASQPINK